MANSGSGYLIYPAGALAAPLAAVPAAMLEQQQKKWKQTE